MKLHFYLVVKLLLIKIQDIQEGCILAEDVFSSTSRPIIPKQTVLTSELIQVLRVFLIKHVEVEKTLVSGDTFLPAITLKDEENKVRVQEIEESEKSFVDKYLQAVHEYRKDFLSWQAGLPINIGNIRGYLLPLLDHIEQSPSDILTLHHFSTKDDYVYQHSIAVGLLSGFIARKAGFLKGEWLQVALAGCLSDCGMSKVNPKILHKQTSLTEEEYNEVKNHPTYSYKMVKDISVLRDGAKIAIFQHHERLDGSGYPTGEKNAKIHPFAKIIAVADTFHAMTSERLYRLKQSPFKVLEMIREDQFGKFDLTAIKALSTALINFSIGTKVKLSDGQMAEILFISDKSPTRPMVKLIENGEIIQLEQNRQLHIDEVLQ